MSASIATRTASKKVKKTSTTVKKIGLASKKPEVLRNGIEYYQALIAFTADAVISIDTKGSIELFNRAAEELFGYTETEILGKNIKMLMPAPHHDKHDAYLSTYLRTGKINILGSRREVEGLRKDGSTMPIEIGIREFKVGGRQIFTGVVRDLTEITESRAEVAEALAVLDSIGTSQAMIEFDLDGNVITANARYLSMMGYTLPEILGKPHSIFVESDYKESAEYREFWNDLRAGVFQSGDFKRITKDGQDVWIQASYNPVLDPDGKPRKIIKNAVDITEKRRSFQDAKALSERQRKDIMELSTPALSVWDGVILLPLIGTLDSYRMQRCTEMALSHMQEEEAQVIIIDITGVPVMDTMVANNLMSLASSVRLMGGQCVVTGISPATAITIVNLGVNLSHLDTRGSLQEGLKLAIKMIEQES